MNLQIKSLATGYEGHTVSEGLSFTIPEHKITALIGPNGCGKSTLLKTICRILPPKQGEILLEGKRLEAYDSQELARRIGILPQNPMAPEGLTVRELVLYGRAPHMTSFFARTSRQDKEIIDWALEETGMGELAERTLKQLSGGQRQRAWIAMAIAQQTDILFLDEPTSFLDVAHQLDILQLVQRLNREHGKTIVMVIHELNEAARFSDYLVAMRKGEILYRGTPQEIFTREMLREVFGIDSVLMTDPRTDRPFCIPYAKGGH